MIATIIFVVFILLAVWSTILFVGNMIHKAGFPALLCIIYAVSVTGVITHLIHIW